MIKFLVIIALLSVGLFAEIQKKSYSSGELKCETNISDGIREGLSTGYHRNGKVKYKTNFKNGKRDGISKKYYKDGVLKTEENYKNGSLNGLTKEYYKSGKLKSDFVFEDDLPISGNKYTEDGQKIEG
ncbi:MAG: hypothetical protein DRG24_04070 [Epsilonproteobacteria bacterium]|nr:MAG: hypothetical protein DRG24_04070 [Campylobacterota bacterium]